MTTKKDIKHETVERRIGELVQKHRMPPEQARRVVIDSANRVNRRRRGDK